MWVILAASVVGLFFFFERMYTLAPQRVLPRAFVDRIRAMAARGETRGAQLLCEENGASVALMMAAALRTSARGATRAEIKESVEEVGGREVAHLDQHVEIVGTVASITPLLGLLGTVWGMIQVFQRFVDAYADGAATPDVFATGIWTALITTAFAPHEPYTVTDDGFRRVKLYAEQLDLPIHLHLHETATEVSDAVNDTGVRPITRLAELDILSPALQAVHMTQLRDDEIELLARHGVQVAHCPESNMKLASGVCRVHDLRAAGINVALGTDGAASNNDLDMLQEVRSATLLSKAHTGDATSLTAQECLEMMTLSGARFFGLEEEIGSLEPGKLADITAIDLSGPTFQPLYDPVSQLIYTATGRDVTHVWINGRQVLKARELQPRDTGSILASTRAWQEKISTMMQAKA